MEDWQVISPDQFMDGPSPVMTGDYDSRSSGELTVHRYNCQVSYVWAADALLRYQRNFLYRRLNALTEMVQKRLAPPKLKEQEPNLADFADKEHNNWLIHYQKSFNNHMWLLQEILNRLRAHAQTLNTGSRLWAFHCDRDSQACLVTNPRIPIFVEIVFCNNLASHQDNNEPSETVVALGLTCNGDVIVLTKHLLQLMNQELLSGGVTFADVFEKNILLRLSIQRALRGSSWRAVSVALGKQTGIVALGNGRVFTWDIGAHTSEECNVTKVRPVSVAGLQQYKIVKVISNGFGGCYALSRSRKIFYWAEQETVIGETNRTHHRAKRCKYTGENEVLLADNIWAISGQKKVVALLSTSSRLTFCDEDDPCKFLPVKCVAAGAEQGDDESSNDVLDGKLTMGAVCPNRGTLLLSDYNGKLWFAHSSTFAGKSIARIRVQPLVHAPPWLPIEHDGWPGWDQISICNEIVFGLTYLGHTWMLKDKQWKEVKLSEDSGSTVGCADSFSTLPSLQVNSSDVTLVLQQLTYPDLSTPVEMIATRAESWNVPMYFSRLMNFNAEKLESDISGDSIAFEDTVELLKPMGTYFEAFFKEEDMQYSFGRLDSLPSDLEGREGEIPSSPQKEQQSPRKVSSRDSPRKNIDWKMWSGGVKSWLKSLEEGTLSREKRHSAESQARRFLHDAQEIWTSMRLPVTSRGDVWELLRRLYAMLPSCFYVKRKSIHNTRELTTNERELKFNTEKITDEFIQQSCTSIHEILSKENVAGMSKDSKSSGSLGVIKQMSTQGHDDDVNSTTGVDIYKMESNAQNLLDDESSSANVSLAYQGYSVSPPLVVESMNHILQDLPRSFRYCSLFHKMDAPLYRRLMQILAAYSVWDQETGYVQGLSYPAALMSLVGESRTTSLLFLCTFTRQPLYLRILRVDADMWNQLCRHFDWLLSRKLPELSTHLQVVGCTCDMYLLGWLQTLFLRCVPVPLGLRLLDGFLLFGSPFLLQTAVALLHVLEPFLINETLDKVLYVLTATSPTSGDSELMQVINQLEQMGPFPDAKNETVVKAWNSVTEESLLPTISAVELPKHTMEFLSALECGEEPPADPDTGRQTSQGHRPSGQDQVLEIFMREMF